MSDKDLVYRLFEIYAISYKKSDSYRKLSDAYMMNGINIPICKFTDFYRQYWTPSPVDLHIKNLESGLLKGHSWHQAMPSMLHLSMQNKVRDCIDGKLSLNTLISVGADIMKHEYFMVATHDICETAIIQNITNTIPPIGSKSISDFVLNGIPYDLKVSTYPDGWNKSTSLNTSDYIKLLSSTLYAGADKERMRKQAEKASSPWAFNRFYVMVENQERWLDEPREMVNEIVVKTKSLGNPECICVHGIDIQIQLIEL